MLDLNKKEAAERVGCTPKTYANYENSELKDSDFFRILRAMGAVVEEKRKVEIYVEGHEAIILKQEH